MSRVFASHRDCTEFSTWSSDLNYTASGIQGKIMESSNKREPDRCGRFFFKWPITYIHIYIYVNATVLFVSISRFYFFRMFFFSCSSARAAHGIEWAKSGYTEKVRSARVVGVNGQRSYACVYMPYVFFTRELSLHWLTTSILAPSIRDVVGSRPSLCSLYCPFFSSSVYILC